MNDNHLHQIGYSLRRYFVDQFFFNVASEISGNSQVLDLGGNKVRKRGYFDIEAYDFDVVYANLVTDKLPDIQCDAVWLPIESNQFDVVICAELLEHVIDPGLILNEIYRVLRPGGLLFLTVPFLFRIHGDPDDFGRYTDHYWQQKLINSGFDAIEVTKQGSFFSVIADFIKNYADYSFKKQDWVSWLLKKNWLAIQNWALKQESLIKSGSEADYYFSYTTGFGIKSKK